MVARSRGKDSVRQMDPARLMPLLSSAPCSSLQPAYKRRGHKITCSYGRSPPYECSVLATVSVTWRADHVAGRCAVLIQRGSAPLLMRRSCLHPCCTSASVRATVRRQAVPYVARGRAECHDPHPVQTRRGPMAVVAQ
jgi:hypothetical protein